MMQAIVIAALITAMVMIPMILSEEWEWWKKSAELCRQWDEEEAKEGDE